ncbi:MAG: TRZ/ATZ family hydrolase [Gammaproteobacteria bacterium]|nr:TRZ/ATZ family hydrolase [Gammaproteobacteria bacterium]
MQTVDTIIHARWIIPVEPENTIYEDHSLLIHEGRILDILPSSEVQNTYQSNNMLELTRHALIPGLINTHTHCAMSLLKGLADDLPLMDWLQNHIWPAEQQWVSPEFVRDGSELAIAEMLRSGTTCFNDMYFFPDETAHVASRAGIRVNIGLIMLDFPTVWANNADEYLKKGIDVRDKFRANPLVTMAFAPHAPYTVSDQPLEQIQSYAEEMDIPVHMHIHETIGEVTTAETEKGQRPLARLNDLGLITPRMMAVHMTQLTEDEIKLVAENGTHVVHCPESNLKLASGYCPVQKLMDTGVNVALGTDGNASNNDLDMLGEMKTAALLAKAVADNAGAMNAFQTLKMATLNGAKAMGLDNEIGSLVKGKAADITAIYLDNIETQPLYNPVSQIVYSAGREHVTDVWVAGKHLLKDKTLTTLNIKTILEKAHNWAKKIGT